MILHTILLTNPLIPTGRSQSVLIQYHQCHQCNVFKTNLQQSLLLLNFCRSDISDTVVINSTASIQKINILIINKFEHNSCQMSETESDLSNDSEQSVCLQKNRRVKSSNKPKNKTKIVLNIADCQYPVVSRVARRLKWKVSCSTDSSDWDVLWTDNAVQPETLVRMEQHQKINHFPGMFHLARKNLMGRYLMKMRKKFVDYSFFPLTWMLPIEYHELKAYFDSRPKGKARTFIVKPEAMSQGKGIFLTRKIQDIQANSHCVVQRYLHRPYLIEGLKFDLRIYVLVTSVDPLRVYMFNEGLTRFATEKYEQPSKDNMEDICMHLTNYSINKDNPKFIFNNNSRDQSKGHKRSLTWLYEHLEKHQKDCKGLKQKIEEMIVKTMIAGLPAINAQYHSCQPENYAANMCFELLGFDIILTEKCEPILLQINHTPSFSTDTPLDDLIKTSFIHDSLMLMNINEKTKQETIKRRKQACQQRIITGKKVKLTADEKEALRSKAQQARDKYERKNLGGFRKIYPVQDQQLMNKYEQFISHAQDGYDVTTGVNNKRASIKKTEKKQQAFGTCFVKKSKQTTPTTQPSIKANVQRKPGEQTQSGSQSDQHRYPHPSNYIDRPNNDQLVQGEDGSTGFFKDASAEFFDSGSAEFSKVGSLQDDSKRFQSTPNLSKEMRDASELFDSQKSLGNQSYQQNAVNRMTSFESHAVQSAKTLGKANNPQMDVSQHNFVRNSCNRLISKQKSFKKHVRERLSDFTKNIQNMETYLVSQTENASNSNSINLPLTNYPPKTGVLQFSRQKRQRSPRNVEITFESGTNEHFQCPKSLNTASHSNSRGHPVSSKRGAIQYRLDPSSNGLRRTLKETGPPLFSTAITKENLKNKHSQKIPITLNTLLINGYESKDYSNFSGNNIRKY